MRKDLSLSNNAHEILSGGGEMGHLIREFNWSNTPLGPIESWPQSLITMTNTCLNSRSPFLIWWGPSLIAIYNDAYIPLFSEKHPKVLGQPAQKVWREPEIWDVISPMLSQVMKGGEATWSEDQQLLLHRKGFLEECYFTWSYSPIYAEVGKVGGILTSVTDVTERFLNERRLKILRELSNKMIQAHSSQQVFEFLQESLSLNPLDLPFMLFYVNESSNDPKQLQLKASIGVTDREIRHIRHMSFKKPTHDSLAFFIAQALKRNAPIIIRNPEQFIGNVSTRPWGEALRHALALPVLFKGSKQSLNGVFIVGLSPLLSLDDNYIGFIELLTGQLEMGLTIVHAYEKEKKRAEARNANDREKTRFLSNVSHEFRTPLTLILGPLEDMLAEVQQLSLRNRQRMELIHSNALRLLKLVNTLLEFSCVEAGHETKLHEKIEITSTIRRSSAYLTEIERWLTNKKSVSSSSSKIKNSNYKSSNKSAHILFADDDRDMRAYVKQLLSTYWQVDAFADGPAAYEAAIKFPYSLLLIDEMTSNLNGFDLVKKLRTTSHTRTIPIVLLSTRAGEKSRIEGLQAGVDDFFVKPFPAKELIATVEAHLKLAESRREIALEREKFYSIFMQAPVLINIFSGPDHIFELSNEASRTFLGGRDLTGLPAQKALPELEEFGFIELLDKVYRDGAPYFGSEKPFDVKINGSLERHYFNFVYKPWRDVRGNIIGVLSVAVEVTEQVIARENLKLAVCSRDEFMSIVSHELKTPVTSLRMFLQMSQQQIKRIDARPYTEKLIKALNTSIIQADRLTRLIEDLLNMSRIQGGKLYFNIQNCNLSLLIGKIVEQFTEQILAANCKMDTYIERNVFCDCDSDRIEQVIVNLFSNAIKYASGKAIYISLRRLAKHIELTVRDEGIGIPQEKQSLIFDRFERAITASHISGLGLGLFIAKEIVNAHDGSIQVKSKEGKGSKFIVRLPIKTSRVIKINQYHE